MRTPAAFGLTPAFFNTTASGTPVNSPALSAHVVVGAKEDCHGRREQLHALLHERFGIDHATLQVEHEQGLLTIQPHA